MHWIWPDISTHSTKMNTKKRFIFQENKFFFPEKDLFKLSTVEKGFIGAGSFLGPHFGAIAQAHQE